MLTKVLLRPVSDTFQLNLIKYSSNWVYAYNKVFFFFLAYAKVLSELLFLVYSISLFFQGYPPALLIFISFVIFLLLYYLHIQKLKLSMHYIVCCSFSFAFFKNSLNIKDHIGKYTKNMFLHRLICYFV